MLSNDLKMAGPKFGCGLSQCGSCTVMIDGEAVKTCQTKAQAAAGRSVTTLEGLRENGAPSTLQQAFIDEQAAQGGYCANGCSCRRRRFSIAIPHRPRPRCVPRSTVTSAAVEPITGSCARCFALLRRREHVDLRTNEPSRLPPDIYSCFGRGSSLVPSGARSYW